MGRNKLNESDIRRLAEGCGFEIHTADKVDSTNNVLKKLAAEGAPHGYMLIAGEQTAGRGRLGRSFFSPQTGIYLSLLLRPHTAPQKTLFYTTAAAVAVCRAIESETKLEAQIKWVNDVYIGSRKVCGILTESSISGGETEWVVIGIGVNVAAPEGGFPAEIADRACALFESGKCPDGFSDRMGAAIARELANVLSEDHFAVGEYRRRSMVVGMEVTAIDGDRERRCKVIDVDDAAALIVEFEDGSLGKLYSGEVSIKL